MIRDMGDTVWNGVWKTIARVHKIDTALLEGLWAQGEAAEIARKGLIAEWTGGDTLAIPELPQLWEGGGFTVDLQVTFDELAPHQVLLDSRNDEGRGMLITTTDRSTLKLTLFGRTNRLPGGRWSGGLTECAWYCDYDRLTTGTPHCITFVVDGGPKVISVVVDGLLCDGGSRRQYGWGRFHADLKEANGMPDAHIASALHGTLHALRIYDRYLRTSEAVANHAKARQ